MKEPHKNADDQDVAGRARSLALMVAAGFRADPWLAGLSLSLDTVSGLSGPLYAIALGWLASATTSEAAWPGAGVAMIALTASLAIHMALGALSWQVRFKLEEKTAHALEYQVVELVTSLEGVSHYEDPKHLRRVEQLVSDNWLIAMSIPALVAATEVLIRLGFTVAILGRVDVLLLLLPLFGLPLLFAGSWAERIHLRNADARADARRRADYVFDVATRSGPAKESRLFGIGPELLGRHATESRFLIKEEQLTRLKGALRVAAGRVLFALGYAGAVIIVASRAVAGDAGVGDLVFTLSLASQLMGQLSSASQRLSWLNWTLSAVRHYVWLLDYEAQARRDLIESGASAAAPDSLTQGIRFEAVSFRLPHEGADILSDVTLELAAGSIVAVVGENGAGKTTLVKMLCRLWEPTTGKITVDGVDLRCIDVSSWRRRTTATFQEPTRYEVLVQEAIGIGDWTRMDPRSVTAAVDRVDAGELIRSLPQNVSTQLGTDWDGGVELSGGQWQKIALARSAMPDRPLLFVLDEPAAALDAATEHTMFTRWSESLLAAQGTTGAVGVLVTHRYSTVAMADQIVVLRGGRVVEAGSHDELIVAKGVYAEFYELESRAYTTDGC